MNAIKENFEMFAGETPTLRFRTTADGTPGGVPVDITAATISFVVRERSASGPVRISKTEASGITIASQVAGASLAISAASNPSDGPVVITVASSPASGHGFSSGAIVRIEDVLGNTAANTVGPGGNSITVVDDDRFSLDGVRPSGPYTSGGTAALYEIGVFRIAMLASDTADLDPGGYYYEARVTLGGVILTVTYGTLTLRKTGI